MYLAVEVPVLNLLLALENKRTANLYIKFLRELNNHPGTVCITIRSYSKACKKYGYKTKSGLWKAIRELEKKELITNINNSIFLEGLRYVV